MPEGEAMARVRFNVTPTGDDGWFSAANGWPQLSPDFVASWVAAAWKVPGVVKVTASVTRGLIVTVALPERPRPRAVDQMATQITNRVLVAGLK